MPSFFGRLIGLDFRTELLIMNIFGLINSTLDWSPIKWTNQLESIRNLSLSHQSLILDTVGEHTVKTILSWVVITRIVIAHVYTFTYVANAYPIITWTRPNFLLPWMLLSFIKNVLLELIVIVIGLLIWYEQRFSIILFLEFIVVKIVPLILASYNWYSNSCLYVQLKRLEKLRRLRISVKRSESQFTDSPIKIRYDSLEGYRMMKYRPRSLMTLASTGSQETNDSISTILDDPDLTAVEKLMKYLKLTEQDIENAKIRVQERRLPVKEKKNMFTPNEKVSLFDRSANEKIKPEEVKVLEKELDTEVVHRSRRVKKEQCQRQLQLTPACVPLNEEILFDSSTGNEITKVPVKRPCSPITNSATKPKKFVTKNIEHVYKCNVVVTTGADTAFAKLAAKDRDSSTANDRASLEEKEVDNRVDGRSSVAVAADQQEDAVQLLVDGKAEKIELNSWQGSNVYPLSAQERKGEWRPKEKDEEEDEEDELKIRLRQTEKRFDLLRNVANISTRDGYASCSDLRHILEDLMMNFETLKIADCDESERLPNREPIQEQEENLKLEGARIKLCVCDDSFQAESATLKNSNRDRSINSKPVIESFATVSVAQVARSSGFDNVQGKPPVCPRPKKLEKKSNDVSKTKKRQDREMKALHAYNKITLVNDKRELEGKRRDESTSCSRLSRKDITYDDYLEKENLFSVRASPLNEPTKNQLIQLSARFTEKKHELNKPSRVSCENQKSGIRDKSDPEIAKQDDKSSSFERIEIPSKENSSELPATVDCREPSSIAVESEPGIEVESSPGDREQQSRPRTALFDVSEITRNINSVVLPDGILLTNKNLQVLNRNEIDSTHRDIIDSETARAVHSAFFNKSEATEFFSRSSYPELRELETSDFVCQPDRDVYEDQQPDVFADATLVLVAAAAASGSVSDFASNNSTEEVNSTTEHDLHMSLDEENCLKDCETSDLISEDAFIKIANAHGTEKDNCNELSLQDEQTLFERSPNQEITRSASSSSCSSTEKTERKIAARKSEENLNEEDAVVDNKLSLTIILTFWLISILFYLKYFVRWIREQATTRRSTSSFRPFQMRTLSISTSRFLDRLNLDETQTDNEMDQQPEQLEEPTSNGFDRETRGIDNVSNDDSLLVELEQSKINASPFASQFFEANLLERDSFDSSYVDCSKSSEITTSLGDQSQLEEFSQDSSTGTNISQEE